MAGWRTHSGRAVLLPLDNVDTDQLIPARFMSTPRSEGYGDFLLHDLRRSADGSLDPSFPLNAQTGGTVLIAGTNFGSGSSREAAVYALADAGFRVVIASSFGDIFAANAINNGVLPAKVSPEVQAELAAQAKASAAEVSIDLDAGVITCDTYQAQFDLEDNQRAKLINGWDDIDMTRSNADEIAAFAGTRRQTVPWAWPTLGA